MLMQVSCFKWLENKINFIFMSKFKAAVTLIARVTAALKVGWTRLKTIAVASPTGLLKIKGVALF